MEICRARRGIDFLFLSSVVKRIARIFHFHSKWGGGGRKVAVQRRNDRSFVRLTSLEDPLLMSRFGLIMDKKTATRTRGKLEGKIRGKSGFRIQRTENIDPDEKRTCLLLHKINEDKSILM